jgi:hypothetical protein
MTNEMKKLYESLSTTKVKKLAGAWDYVGNEINKMDMDGTYQFEMSKEALKNCEKEYKILRKYYNGKIDINPNDSYMKYPENSSENFFLKCIVMLMQYNGY